MENRVGGFLSSVYFKDAELCSGWYKGASVGSGPEHRSNEKDLDLNPVSAASDKLSKPQFSNL